MRISAQIVSSSARALGWSFFLPFYRPTKSLCAFLSSCSDIYDMSYSIRTLLLLITELSITFSRWPLHPVTPVFSIAYRSRQRKPLRIMERTVRSWVSRARVFSPIENVLRRNMNMLMSLENKVGKIRPKFTINHQRFCCAIEKNIWNVRPRTIVANLKITFLFYRSCVGSLMRSNRARRFQRWSLAPAVNSAPSGPTW